MNPCGMAAAGTSALLAAAGAVLCIVLGWEWVMAGVVLSVQQSYTCTGLVSRLTVGRLPTSPPALFPGEERVILSQHVGGLRAKHL